MEPSRTSGGRYHSVTTSCEYVCDGTDLARARPTTTRTTFQTNTSKKNSSDAEVVKQNVTKQLKEVSQNEFLKCFGELYERWGK